MINAQLKKRCVKLATFSSIKPFAMMVLLAFSSSICVYAQKMQIVTESLPPFQIVQDNGKIGGYATEVIQALLTMTNDSYTLKVIPWARAYDKALKEPNVIIYSMGRTQAREALFHWVGGLRYERFYFWGLRSKFSTPYSQINEIKDISISSPNSHNSEQYLTRQGFTRIYRVVNSDQQVQMLFRHRVDLVLGNSLIIKSQAEALGYDAKELFPVLEAKEMSNSLAIALSKPTSHETVVKYQLAFKQLVDSGKLAQIKRQWSIIDDSQ